MSAGWTLRFGALHDGKLAEQLVAEAAFDATAAAHFQLDAQAITRLLIRGYVGDAKVQAMRHSLTRQIEAEMKRMNEKREPTTRGA